MSEIEKQDIAIKVAILTTGDDSQAVNAAIRSVGRMIISLGGRPFAVRYGYDGLLEGCQNITEYKWINFTQILHKGGTILGSVPSKEFRTPEGRLKACFHLVSMGIDRIVVIGGDGSLKGAELLRTEWANHIKTLLKEEKITLEQSLAHPCLILVGIIGSLNNDFCGTDITISTDSALHRIVNVIDSIITTAESHNRGFVIQISGERAGFLTLSSALCVGSEYVFIPEHPSSLEWRKELKECIDTAKDNGKGYSIVLLAEGSKNILGEPITANMVVDFMNDVLDMETRATILGHIQRGGSPSAHDRILASRQGIEAAINIMKLGPEDPSYVICTRNVSIFRQPLPECLALCDQVEAAYDRGDINEVVRLRGPAFQRNLELFKLLKKIVPSEQTSITNPQTLGLLHFGKPTAGMDPCTRAFVIWCVSNGHKVIGFKNGFEGIEEKSYMKLKWKDVKSLFSNSGSSLIGTSKYWRDKLVPKVAEILEKKSIRGLVIIGSIKCIHILEQLHKGRTEYHSLRIPIIMVPAAQSNNIPLTTFALGSDTTLNTITKCCDALRQSAAASRKRIFVVETFGKGCGYLPLMSALSSAAENGYSWQNSPKLSDILKDIEILKRKFYNRELEFGLLMVSDKFSDNYNTDMITQMLNDLGTDVFTGRSSVIGYAQIGSVATPFDRFLSANFGTKVAEKMLALIGEANSSDQSGECMDESSCCMIGYTCDGYHFVSFKQVAEQIDYDLNAPKNAWWMDLTTVIRILAHADFTYKSVTIPEIEIQSKGL